MNLAYGFLAAALAQLTDGIIFSDDMAWDYERFPCRSEDFLLWYFEPERAIDPRFARWSEASLARLIEDLTPV